MPRPPGLRPLLACAFAALAAAAAGLALAAAGRPGALLAGAALLALAAWWLAGRLAAPFAALAEAAPRLGRGDPVALPGAAPRSAEAAALAEAFAGLLAGRDAQAVALQEAHRRSSDILESIGEAFYAVDSGWRFTYLNGRAAELAGRRPEELLGRTLWEAFPPVAASEVGPPLRRAMAERRPERFEARSPLRDAWIAVAAYPLGADGLAVYFHDVTERRRAEAARDAVLAEKEAMLREIHHRVKNNLQVMWSLMRLETREIDDPLARERLDMLGRRIGVMGRIHDQLYATEDFGRIDLAAHLDELVRGLQVLPQHRGTAFALRAAPLACPLEHAVPFGLVANELLALALKGGGRSLAVELARREDGRAELAVASDAPFAADALSLRLVEALAAQLGGSAALEPARATLLLPADRLLG
ncbi:MAG TPA: histidine kinase dimerization/phosphoacceptor domain -containing protein [Alphaproteobacteria bacterium]|nr:histidine kinase dimerization/phosphoacceptor domain -containing protein [Alphaproteobacteria bacterium]